jgi:hypothetical protein
MKKLSILIFILLILPGFLRAAGSNLLTPQRITGTDTENSDRYYFRDMIVLRFDWTAASDGSVPSNTTGDSVTNMIKGWYIYAIRTIPGSPSPTDNYDVDINDAFGNNTINDVSDNCDTTNAEWFYPSKIAIPVDGALTLAVSNNYVNGAKGIVKLYLVKYPVGVADFQSDGSGTSGDVAVFGSGGNLSGDSNFTWDSSTGMYVGKNLNVQNNILFGSDSFSLGTASQQGLIRWRGNDTYDNPETLAVWETGIDTANSPTYADLVLAARGEASGVSDFIYLRNGRDEGKSPSLGVGVGGADLGIGTLQVKNFHTVADAPKHTFLAQVWDSTVPVQTGYAFAVRKDNNDIDWYADVSGNTYTQHVYGSDGGSTTPTYTFDSEKTLGFYRGASGKMIFMGGQLGILGTPSVPLHVFGDTYIESSQATQLRFTSDGNNSRIGPITSGKGLILQASGSDRLAISPTSGLFAVTALSSSHPAWKKNGTYWEARLGDDSAYTDVVGKNLQATGYLLGPQYYCEMYSYNNSTSVGIDTVSTYFVNSSGVTAGYLNGCTFNTGVLTVLNEGTYEVKASVGMNGGVAKIFHVSLLVNGSQINKCHMPRSMGASGDHGSVSMSCLIDINANDTVAVSLENVTDGTDVTVNDSNMILRYIGPGQ